MPSRAKKSGDKEVHTHLFCEVAGYDASVSTKVNPIAYQPEYGWRSDPSDPVYELQSQLELSCDVIYPNRRAGTHIEMTIYSEKEGRIDLGAQLADIEAKDEHGATRFRDYRGRTLPIYRPPLGLGVLEKVRGEPVWTAAFFVAQELVDQWLALLTARSTLFASLHECKVARKRWIREVGLQTVNPSAG